MDIKVSVDFDLGSFRELYSDNTLEDMIIDEIKREVLKKVKATSEYKLIVEEREKAMMAQLKYIN